MSSIVEMQKQAREALDAAQDDLDGVSKLDETICEVEEAFGLAYPDGTFPTDGYQPWAARGTIDALAVQLRAFASKLVLRADTLARFSEQLQRSAEMDDTPTEPGIAVVSIVPEKDKA